MIKFAVIFIASCGLQDVGGGAGIDLGFGEVFQCSAEDNTGRQYELCYDGDADTLALDLEYHDTKYNAPWRCGPTSRHLGPCYFHCPPGAGCNALNSCWCPKE